MEHDMPESLTLLPSGALHFADPAGDARLMQKLTIRMHPSITSASLRFHVKDRIAACHIDLTPVGQGKVTYISLLGEDDLPFKVSVGAGDASIVLRRKPGIGPVHILLRDHTAPLCQAVPLVHGPAWQKSGRTDASDTAEVARLSTSIASGHSHAPVMVSSALPHFRTPARSDLALTLLGALADNPSDDTVPLALTLLLAAKG